MTGPGNTRGTPCSTTCFTGNSPSPPNQIFSPIPRREDPQEQPDNEAGRSPTRTPPRTPQSRHTIEFNAAPTADRWIGAKALPRTAVEALLETAAQDHGSQRQIDWAERDLALILTALLAGLRA